MSSIIYNYNIFKSLKINNQKEKKKGKTSVQYTYCSIKCMLDVPGLK